MISILALWLPILLSAVIVFVASSLIHMLFGYHANDLQKLPNEEGVLEALRKQKMPDGQYLYPRAADREEMKTPAFKEKLARGPRVILTYAAEVRPSMGTYFIQWFLYCLLVSVFVAYVTGRALLPGATYLAAFRFAGATAFFCYAVGGWQESIWFGRPWSTTFKNTVDGLIYALLTGGTFGWLWPQ